MAQSGNGTNTCSPTDRDCGHGQLCYIELDGYRCRPSYIAGCVVGKSSMWPVAVNQPIVGNGDLCTHCAIPQSLEVRQQMKKSERGIVDDNGWKVFGNCKRGYCGLNGFCRPPKETGSLCWSGTQCLDETCSTSSKRDGQLVCGDAEADLPENLHTLVSYPLMVVGAFNLLLGIIAYFVYRRIRSRRRASYVEEALKVAKKLKFIRISAAVTALLGVVLLSVGIAYHVLRPAYSVDDDTNE